MDYNKIRKSNKDCWLANGHEIASSHNSTCKTHLEEVCRDTLRPGHPMKICCFKSHKLKVIFGHLLFNVLHSRGDLRYLWNLCAVPSVICKTENGSKALDHDEMRSKRRLDSSRLSFMNINYDIHVIGLELEILPFLLSLTYSQEHCL